MMTETANTTPLEGTIIGGCWTDGGAHCETTALRVLLQHAGLDVSESLLFGLGSGLSFVYWDSKHQERPFLGGRVKPFALTQNLARRLEWQLDVQETSSPRKAWDAVRGCIDRGIPVGLQLDSHDLEYFTSGEHFAGHVVAMYGYDADRAYLVDTAQQGGAVSTSLESLARARAARGPMSARHRSFTLQSPSEVEGQRIVTAIIPAILECAADFLAPPIANVGNRGIRTAAKRVRSWLDRVEDPGRDLSIIATMMERAGTGGALFRNLYRDFLTESLGLLEPGPAADLVAQGRDRFAESARLWSAVSELIARAGRTEALADLIETSELLEEIATIETSAMSALRALENAENEPSHRT